MAEATVWAAYYERGGRPIPRVVALATQALEAT
jgi:hypothetical protein